MQKITKSLILDDVATGLGRSQVWFGHQLLRETKFRRLGANEQAQGLRRVKGKDVYDILEIVDYPGPDKV